MDLGPLNRLSGSPALAHGGELRTVGPYLGVAVHAGLSGGDSGVRGPFHVRVAVTAVKAQLFRVKIMVEGYGLNGCIADTSEFRC